jgi:hypothetical protein
MTEQTDNLILRHLQQFREEMGAFRKETEQKFSVLAEGMVGMRKDIQILKGEVHLLKEEIYQVKQDVRAMRSDIQILALAMDGHTQRILSCEDRVTQLEDGRPRHDA